MIKTTKNVFKIISKIRKNPIISSILKITKYSGSFRVIKFIFKLYKYIINSLFKRFNNLLYIFRL